MKAKKIASLSVILLTLITLLSINLLSLTVTLKGEGRGTTQFEANGDWSFECDGSNNPCTLTVSR